MPTIFVIMCKKDALCSVLCVEFTLTLLTCSACPLKADERAGLLVEVRRSHPVTPPDSTEMSEASQEDKEEKQEREDQNVMYVSLMTRCWK